MPPQILDQAKYRGMLLSHVSLNRRMAVGMMPEVPTGAPDLLNAKFSRLGPMFYMLSRVAILPDKLIWTCNAALVEPGCDVICFCQGWSRPQQYPS